MSEGQEPATPVAGRAEPGTFLGRLLRGWSLDSNPLRRHLDRIETVLVVPAVLTQDPFGTVTYGYASVSVPEAQARWTSPAGHQMTGVVSAPGGLHKGSTTLIWVDRSGQAADGPVPPSEAANRAAMAAIASIAVLVLLALGAGKLGRYALDRRRLAAWDADWRATGPLWTFRR